MQTIIRTLNLLFNDMALLELIQSMFFGAILLGLFGLAVFMLNIVTGALDMNTGFNNYGIFASAVILGAVGIYLIIRPVIGGD